MGSATDAVINAAVKAETAKSAEAAGGGGGNQAKAPVTTTVPVGRPSSVGLSGPSTGIYGVHPSQKRMKIIRMSGNQVQVNPTNDFIVAHYNPQDFAEVNSVNYMTDPAVGVVFARSQWGHGNPRKWSMRILLSEWGDDRAHRSPGYLPTEETISWLRNSMYPGDPETWTLNKSPFLLVGNSSDPGKMAPPPLMIILMRGPIIAYLVNMHIKRLKLHPVSLVTIRAEVSLDFLEFLPAAM